MRTTGQRRQGIFLFGIWMGVIGVSLCLGEVTVRYLVVYDLDGNCQLSILNKTLYIRPFHLPFKGVKALLQQYQSQQSYLMYDSILGWVQRPSSSSGNGLYHANAQGVRKGSTDESTRSGKPGLQIVLLGDSYTHGDDVPFEHTWGLYLEKKLTAAGIRADIVNLGTPGYGMDQAYLRWKKAAAEFSPDIVIFGFQPENVKRNLNILRKLYHKPSRMPFSKPRFVRAGLHLEPINHPTTSPDKLLEIFSGIDAWKDKRHEYYYRSADYEDHIWLKSKLLAISMASVEHLWVERRERAFYAVEDEPSQLALAILNELKSDVLQQGAAFLVVAFIPTWDFTYVSEGRPLPYENLLEAIKKQYDTVETWQQLFAQMKDGNLQNLSSEYHYSARANQIVAEVIAEAIVASKPTRQQSHEHNTY